MQTACLLVEIKFSRLRVFRAKEIVLRRGRVIPTLEVIAPTYIQKVLSAHQQMFSSIM